MEGKIRAFICIEIPEEIRARMHAFQETLKGTRPVPMGNMHVTMLFLGNVDFEGIRKFSKAMDLSAIRQFRVSIEGVHAFRHGPSAVVYAGVTDGREELAGINSGICKAAGLEAEPYVPHATIARSNRMKEFHSNTGIRFGSFTCNALKMKRSVLDQGSPEYSDIYETALY